MRTHSINGAERNDSSANCGNTFNDDKAGAVASGPHAALGEEQATVGSEAGMDYTFQIFRDWQGLYRWKLTDALGRRIEASRFSFSALGSACRDLELIRAAGEYSGARIQDNTGR